MRRRLILGLLTALGALDASAQVQNISAWTLQTSDSADVTVGGITYRNNFATPLTVTTTVGTYNAGTAGAGADDVFIRRNTAISDGVANVAGQGVMFASASGGSATVLGTYTASLEEQLLEGNVLNATFDTFANTTSGTGIGHNIERIDFVWTNGYTVIGDEVLIVFNYDPINAQDDFRIAVFTGIDGSTNKLPTAYANSGVLVTGTNYPDKLPLPSGNTTTPTTGFRTTPADDLSGTALNRVDTGTNGIGGVAISLATLGISAGQTIFGYSLLSGDTNAASAANLLDFTNSTLYPTSTPNADQSGTTDFSTFGGRIATLVANEQVGPSEWDGGAGATNQWGSLNGSELNNNWFSTVPAENNRTPLRDSEILFGAIPNSNQTVDLNNSVEARKLTFDSDVNYTIGTSGEAFTITLGDPNKAGLPSIEVDNTYREGLQHKINADLLLVENLAINNNSYSTLCINGTVETSSTLFPSGTTITVDGFGAVNFNGDISGPGDLIKNGVGIATINNDNSNDPDGAGSRTAWSGDVTVNNGQLVITATGALGTSAGTTTVNSGGSLTLRNGVNYTATETITLNGKGVYEAASGGFGALYNDGGDNTLGTNVSVRLGTGAAIGSRDGNLTIAGVVSGVAAGATLTKVGQGTVTLSGANTYTGATIIQAGELRVTATNAIPAASNLQLAGGVLELGVADYTAALGVNGGQVRFTGDGGFSAFGAARTVNIGGGTALTWASTANFLGNNQALLLSSDVSNNTLTFQNAIDLNGGQREFRVANGSATVDAVLSGNLTDTGVGGLVKTGSGTLDLTGSNDYTGATEIRDGALRGNVSTGSNLQLNGGVRELNAASTTLALGIGAGQVRWTGSGGFSAHTTDSTVTLDVVGNANDSLTWGTTPSFLAAGSTLRLGSVSADKTLTLANNLNLGTTGTRTIQTVAGTAAVANGALSGVVSGSAGLAVTGNGRLDLTADNIHTGAVTITGAEVRLSGTMATVSDNGGTSGFNVRQGGKLYLDGSSTAANRIGDSTDITLNGGRLDFVGSVTGTSSTETVGVLLVTGGENQINVQRSGTNATVLAFDSLSRAAGSTIEFTNDSGAGTLGDAGNNPRVTFTTSPTLEQNILPYAVFNDGATPSRFATISGGVLTGISGTNTAETAWTAAIIANPNGDITLTNNRTVGAIRLSNGDDVTGASRTLTLETGAIFKNGGTASNISVANLQVGGTGNRELITHVYNTGGLNISSVIQNNSNTTGLTKSGSGTLTLSGTTANTYTGVTTVNDGTLVLGKSDGVIAVAGNIKVGDGRGIDTLRLGGDEASTNTGNEQIANTATVTLQGGEVGNSANVARFELNGETQTDSAGRSRVETFGTLAINGNSVLDFGGGNVCSPTFLYLDVLDVASDALLTITNWTEFTDFFLVKKTGLDTTDLPRVVFDGHTGPAIWTNYDANYYQITAPIPEPATYGALALGGLTAFAVYRRRQKRLAA